MTGSERCRDEPGETRREGGRGGEGRERGWGEEVRGRSGGTAPSEERETSSPIPSSSPGASELGPSAKEIAWDDFPYLRNL